MHRFPYIKTIDLASKSYKGSVPQRRCRSSLVTIVKNLDVTHMGIIVKDAPDAEPYLLHASSTHGKVEVTALPLAEFMKKNRRWLGVRVFRLKE